MNKILDVSDIKKGFPGISKILCAHHYEAFMVCMHKCEHKTGKILQLSGDLKKTLSLQWEDYFDEQIDSAWQDEIEYTDNGAVCLSALLVKECTDYTIIRRARIGTGIDYWLGKENDILFQDSARLEISGIFEESKTNTVQKRFNKKKRQVQSSDSTSLPVYISIIEFSSPKAFFAKETD